MQIDFQAESHAYLGAKLLGGYQNGRAPMAYLGLIDREGEQHVFAGHGFCSDSVTPFAFGIIHTLDLFDNDEVTKVVFPSNKAVFKYVQDYVPVWRERHVNGKSKVPEGRDQWIEIEKAWSAGKFTIYPGFQVFKAEAQQISQMLERLSRLTSILSLQENRFIRLDRHALADLGVLQP